MSKLRLFLTLGMAVVLALASPLVGQSVTLPATGGGFFYVIVNGDTVSQHTTERAAAAAALTAQRHDTLAVVTYDTKRSTRVVVSPGFFARGVDTVVVDRPILAPLDTVLVYPLIGGSFRAFYDGTGYREVPADSVTPPPTDTVVTPPVDTVTPPPVDTVTPPPVDTTPPVVVPPPTASARLLVTPDRQASWAAMLATGHPMVAIADKWCQGNPYGDTGLWCAWWYMATGDQAAGRKAVSVWLATTTGTNLNTIREDYIEKAVTYDWLCGTGVATTSECATMRQRLDGWKAICQNTRVADGDQSIGCYFGRVAHAFAIGDLSDIAAAGGLDRTGNDRSTPRNTVGGYLDHMDGGALGESYAYDVGTALLAIMGTEVVKTATGIDHFPEFPLADLARYQVASYTPDLRQPLQWWDDQDPRDVTGRLFKRQTLFAGIQGVTKDPQVTKLIDDLIARYGLSSTAQPWARFLIFFDPRVPPAASDWTGTWLANGHGMLYRKTSTTLGWLAAFPKTDEDHEYGHLFDVQLYRNGGWGLTKPIGYAGEAVRVLASNGLSLAGFGSMGTRGMTWADTGATWIALAGETKGGAYDGISYYDPPPPFVRYAGRTAVEATIGQTSVVITRDTVDMDDPRTLPKFDRYRAANPSHQVWIQDADGKPWTIWHQPVQPTVTGQVVTWTAQNGDPVRLEFFADQPVQTATYDETALWGGGTSGGIRPGEKGWHTRSYTPARVLWSVVQVGPALPVSRRGDTITVGGVAFTVTSAGVVGP